MYRSFVAIGDSFTEGLDDRWPDGTVRGWADRVAEALARHDDGFRYANLAVRGRRMPRIVLEQLPKALELHPDLVSIAAGGNDILRLTCDVDRLTRTFDATLARLCAGGATVVTFAGFDPRRRIPLTQIPGGRAEAFNDGIRAAAARHGALLVDLWDLPYLYEDGMWAGDRLHLSADGHDLVAAAVLDVLGATEPAPASLSGELLSVSGQKNRQQLTAQRADRVRRWGAARGEDATWLVRHFTPWVAKGIVATRAQQDALLPKRPDLSPVAFDT